MNDIYNIICIEFLQSGRSTLHAAAASRWSNKQVVESLIKAGADVNSMDQVSCYQVPNIKCNSK